MKELPIELLNKLFAPSTIYSDLATRLHGQNVDGQDFEQMGDEALDLLKFDVEVLNVPDEFSDSKTSVSIDDKSRKMMTEAFKELGATIKENQKDIREDAVKTLFYDMDQLLSPLDAPEMEDLRAKLEVQPEWMDAVGSLHAFHELMEYARKSRTPQWWSWFMQGAGTPSLTGEEGTVAAISLLSRRHRSVSQAPYPPEYSEPWADWALQGKKWKSLGVMHGLWLASTLSDPEKKLANQLDARGFTFDMKEVDWTTAIVHAHNLSGNDVLRCREVEKFLTSHLETLVKMDPEFARNPHITEVEKDGWDKQNVKNLSGKKGLPGLLENVIKVESRREMVATLNRHVLALDTPSTKGHSRSSPRL